MPVRRYRGDKAKADKLFSQIIRSLGYCEAEGWGDYPCSKQLQTAHICSRKRSATRTDLRNAFCLCAAHHRHFTDYPRQFSYFITDTWAQEYYEETYQRSLLPTKIDWRDEANRLADIYQKIQSGETTLDNLRKEG